MPPNSTLSNNSIQGKVDDVNLITNVPVIGWDHVSMNMKVSTYILVFFSIASGTYVLYAKISLIS